MISNRRSDANCEVLIKCIGENLLPTAQAWGPWRPGSPVAAPRAGNRHTDLLCYLWPGQALITELKDLSVWTQDVRRTATTHSDAGAAKLMAHGGPGNAQLGTDLPQGPTADDQRTG